MPAYRWRKSSHSLANGNCAEVGQAAAVIAVRDTKDGEGGPVLAFSGEAWARFTAAVKRAAG